MLDLAVFPIFLAGAIALALVPGPDMAFTLATTASRGMRAGFAAMGGIMVGGAAWVISAAAGLAAALAATEHALDIIRYAGGAYLVWLAIDTLRHLDAAPKAEAASSAWPAFRRGMLTNLMNPKVGLFFIAFLPQFANPAIGPVWLQMLILGAIFFAIGSGVLVAVIFGAGAVRRTLVGSIFWRRALNGLAATAFGGLGLRLLLTRGAG